MVSRGKNTPLCVASGAKTCTFVCFPECQLLMGIIYRLCIPYSCVAESLIEKLTHDCRS